MNPRSEFQLPTVPFAIIRAHSRATSSSRFRVFEPENQFDRGSLPQISQMVADGFLQEVTERTATYQRADPFGLFTEGNEGNEDPLPAHIARVVLLVIFC
jgi:hypothetical protein